MRSVILAPLFLLTLGAAPGEADDRQTADPARKCAPPILTAGAKPGGPARKLNEEPPAALIATVAAKVDGPSPAPATVR